MRKLRNSISCLLVLVLALGLLGTGALADAAGENTLEVTKTIGWDQVNDPNNATITVVSEIPDETDTKTLFLGSLCNGHGLTKDTVTGSINAIAHNSDVRYYLFSDNDIKNTTTDNKNYLKRGGSISWGGGSLTLHTTLPCTAFSIHSIMN